MNTHKRHNIWWYEMVNKEGCMHCAYCLSLLLGKLTKLKNLKFNLEGLKGAKFSLFVLIYIFKNVRDTKRNMEQGHGIYIYIF